MVIHPVWCVIHPGLAEGGGPVPTEAVCYSSGPTAVPQLPQPGSVTLTDLETDEAAHAGRTCMKEYDLCLFLIGPDPLTQFRAI